MDGLVVGGEDDGVENLYFLHDALETSHLDVVSDFVRTEKQDDDTSGEVLEVARKCHADGDTRGCKECGEGSGFDAERGDGGDEK